MKRQRGGKHKTEAIVPGTLKATIWFDGACSGNPGPMGAGAILEVGGRRQALSKNMGRGTNNQAEYHGVILGLRHALAAGVDDVTLRGDSQLILRQLGGSYKVKAENLRPLYEEARSLLLQFAKSRLEWVPRLENAEADQAARDAIGQR